MKCSLKCASPSISIKFDLCVSFVSIRSAPANSMLFHLSVKGLSSRNSGRQVFLKKYSKDIGFKRLSTIS